MYACVLDENVVFLDAPPCGAWAAQHMLVGCMLLHPTPAETIAPQALVRYKEGSDKVYIQFMLAGKQRNMERCVGG